MLERGLGAAWSSSDALMNLVSPCTARVLSELESSLEDLEKRCSY